MLSLGGVLPGLRSKRLCDEAGIWGMETRIMKVLPKVADWDGFIYGFALFHPLHSIKSQLQKKNK